MLRFLIGFLLLTSCSLGTKSSGGKHRYRYEPDFDYNISDLHELSSGIVLMEKRDPRVGKLDKLFDKKLPDIKRIGIVVFETQIQTTRSGLSGEDKIYVTEQGKQLITEKFLSLWEEGMTLAAPDLDYVRSEEIKGSKALPQYGLDVPDYIKATRTKIEPDDILWLPPGKKTPMYTTMNPRGMRDLSFMLVPAAELMGGPKWSEQNKIFVNDIARELRLDALLVIMSEVSWSTERKDKFTSKSLAEELNLKIKATTLIPFSGYHERLKLLKESNQPIMNIAYRYHEGSLNIPLAISIPESEQNFSEIEKRLLNPMFKAYRDLSIMMIDQIATEIRKTH
jgi:hypothetical protein